MTRARWRSGRDPVGEALARAQFEAERRAGVPYRLIQDILAGRSARGAGSGLGQALIDLTLRQLRRRGPYGQAALITDQEVARERDPGRAIEVRMASDMLKKLAQTPAQIEFSFFNGNVSVGVEYTDTVLLALRQSGVTGSEQRTALAVLLLILRYLRWQSYECEKNGAELAALLAMDTGDMTCTLKLLEDVKAITRVRQGSMKTITINPEGTFRGDINRHSELVERYRVEVMPTRRQWLSFGRGTRRSPSQRGGGASPLTHGTRSRNRQTRRRRTSQRNAG